MRLALALLLLAPLTAQAGGLFTPDTSMVGLSRGGANVANVEDIVGGLYYNPAGLFQLDGFHVEGGLALMRQEVSFERSGGDGGDDFGQFNVDSEGVVIDGSQADPFPTARSIPHFRPIPEAGIAYGFKKPDITVALGIYAPLAPTQRYDPFGPGRYRLVEQELIQGNINLAASWKMADWFALGVGLQLLVLHLEESFTASADLIATRSGAEVNPENPDWDITAHFSATQVRPHFNLGALFMPLPWLRVGVTFSPPYELEGTGEAELSGTLGRTFFSNPAISDTLQFGDQPIHVTGKDDDIVITTALPAQLKVGVRFEPVAGILDFEVDGHFEFWGGEADVVASEIEMPLFYDDPDVEGDEVPVPEHLASRGASTFTMCDYISAEDGCSGLDVYRGEGGTGRVAVPARFGTSWSVRFGGEVNPLPFLGVRFGYAFESAAIPLETQALTMLDSDKHLASGGLELRIGAWQRDQPSIFDVRLTYAFVHFPARDVSDPRARTIALDGVPTNPIDAGVYSGQAHTIGVTLAAHVSAMADRDRKNRSR